MRGVLYAMPPDPNDLALYLDNVEQLFVMNAVDEDLRVSLLTPHLTKKISTVDVEYARRRCQVFREFEGGSTT